MTVVFIPTVPYHPIGTVTPNQETTPGRRNEGKCETKVCTQYSRARRNEMRNARLWCCCSISAKWADQGDPSSSSIRGDMVRNGGPFPPFPQAAFSRSPIPPTTRFATATLLLSSSETCMGNRAEWDCSGRPKVFLSRQEELIGEGYISAKTRN